MVSAAALVCVWMALRRNSTHRLDVRTYFRHADLERGTLVSVDGLVLGSVKNVTVRPEVGERPVEVEMEIRTPYDLQIPTGSIAEVTSQGVLGRTVVDIDTRRAVGPPIRDGGVLESNEIAGAQAAHAMHVLRNAVIESSKKLQDRVEAPGLATDRSK